MSTREYESRQPSHEPELLSMRPGYSPSDWCCVVGCDKPVSYEAIYSDGSHGVFCLEHGDEEAEYAGLAEA